MLVNEEKENIARVLKSYQDVAAAYLFGSQNKGNATEESDVDVGVVLRGGESDLKKELEIGADISRAIGRDVDVRVLSLEQSPVFLMQAVRGDLLVGYDQPERVAFEVGVAKLHDDAQKYFKIAQYYVGG